jgi:hypothetical protein
MTTVALLSAEAQLLGFLLIAGEDLRTDDAEERDCILTGVPADRSLLSHELCAVIQNHKNVEFVCHSWPEAGALHVKVEVESGSIIALALPAVGRGTWHVERGTAKSVAGLCERLGFP